MTTLFDAGKFLNASSIIEGLPYEIKGFTVQSFADGSKKLAVLLNDGVDTYSFVLSITNIRLLQKFALENNIYTVEEVKEARKKDIETNTTSEEDKLQSRLIGHKLTFTLVDVLVRGTPKKSAVLQKLI